MSEAGKAVEAVALIVAAYPRQEFPAVTQKLYIRMLADIPGELLMGAVQDLISRNTFLPSIAEVRQAAGRLQERASGALDAYSAWDMVQKQIVRVGSYGIPELDALTRRAVNAVGGWRLLCLSENGMADRSQFIRAYETLASRAREESNTLPAVRKLIDHLGGNIPQLEDKND